MNLDLHGNIIVGKKVALKPYNPPALIERQFMTEQEILDNAGSELIIDSESFPNYFMVGFKHVRTGKYIKLSANFNRRFLYWLLMSYKTIGFNSINYDLPMLWAAYSNTDPLFLKEVSNALIYRQEMPKVIAKEFNFECYPILARQHIDLINVCPLKRSLKIYGGRLHSERIQDLPIPNDKYLTAEEIKIVDQYNYNDLDVTELIYTFDKMQERLQLREAISIEYNEDLMSKSDAQMAEVVIAKKVSELNGKWCKRPTIEAGTVFKYQVPKFLSFATKPMQELLERVKKANFVVDHNGKIISPDELELPAKIGNNYYAVGIGGLHSKDKCKAYEAKDGYKLKDIDVTSYYPAIIINLGLFPIGMGPNFLNVYKNFRAQRVEAKKRKDFTRDKGLKIFLNGTSGKFSDFYSKMYSPNLTIQMNLTGQLSILMLAELFECQGIEVVSANTDGLVIYYKEDKEEAVKYWWKHWEKLTNFQLEDTEYTKYYARDVNAYFAVKTDDAIRNKETGKLNEKERCKVKGPYSEVGSQSGTQLDNNPKMLICSDAIKAFLAYGTPIEKTIRECQDITRFIIIRDVKGGAHKDGHYLGKVVRWAYYKNTYGTINYVLTGNKVPETEGAVPLQDLPNEFPVDKIDYDRYIMETENILYDIGYFERPKQVDFFI